MELLLKNTSLIQRAYWLVALRWVAIATLAIASFAATRFMGIQLRASTLYTIAGVLVVYNFILYDLLRYWTWGGREPTEARIGGIITFQISADLFILTTILHFAGGIENPFAFFFVFHMILASVLRSKLQSYLQATLAVVLFGGIIVLEASGVVKHWGLEGFAAHGLYDDKSFVFGFLFVFSITLFLVVYMTTSISEQLRQQQNSYEQANALLHEKDQLKNQYVLRLTHDIKGHLAAIQSCLDIVFNGMVGPLNEEQTDLVERAYRRTGKCLSFITSLLRLTRMKLAGRIEMERFSLRNSIFNALAAVQNKARNKAIAVTHTIDPSVDEIPGESVLIEETATNILFNAVKYTSEGGKVALDVKDDGAFVKVTVTDTGIGIPAGAMEHIFEEFYRADNAQAAERDGTGLGLAFAKEVVERHGGRIWALNNPDGGSTFVFTLPKGAAGSGA
ncbi:MAG: HAMP domain-containing histidine kinase [Sedimentisphaerales bacterium]|nr:HAMP domain-containing histidine kinase [Sedimentisphaerales bacterium]